LATKHFPGKRKVCNRGITRSKYYLELPRDVPIHSLDFALFGGKEEESAYILRRLNEGICCPGEPENEQAGGGNAGDACGEKERNGSKAPGFCEDMRKREVARPSPRKKLEHLRKKK